VTVSVTDSGGTPNGGDDTSPDQTFDITVDAINDEPSFTTLGDQVVDEDSGAHTVAGFATPAPGGGADESGQTFTYSVSNDNAGLFAVGPTIDANGQLTYTLNSNVNGSATVTVSVTDSGDTPNGGDDTSPDQTFDITVDAVNDEPSFTMLGDQTVDEDSGPHTVAGFATPAPGGGADESGQTFTYNVSNDNAGLFAVGPAIDANGQLTYTLNADAAGSATVTVSVTDSGGTPNGGDDTSPDQTFDITVDAINDEPSFTTLGDQTVDEDSGPHAVAGFATPAAGGGSDESGQTFTYSVSNDNAALFAVGPAIDASGTLTYALTPDASGAATVTVSVTDSGGTPNGGDDTSPDQTFDITVIAVNDAPSVALSNTVTSLEETTLTTSSIKIADIVISDDSLGTNNLTLSGADAASFEIMGGDELHLKAGTALDFETKTTYDVTVEVNDPAVGAVPDDAAGHTLNITDVDESVLDPSDPEPDPDPDSDPDPEPIPDPDPDTDPDPDPGSDLVEPPSDQLSDPVRLTATGVLHVDSGIGDSTSSERPGRDDVGAGSDSLTDGGASEELYRLDLLRERARWDALDNLADQISEDSDRRQADIYQTTARVEGTTLAISAGLLALITRGSSLTALLLSALPVWSRVDPLSVLLLSEKERRKREEELRDAEILEDEKTRLGDVLGDPTESDHDQSEKNPQADDEESTG